MKSWQRNKDYEPCITEDAEPRHRGRRAKPQKGRPCHGPENSGKNRRGGRNPLAKKRRLREEPAFGFPFLNWWRWWELNPRAPDLCTPHLRV